MNKKEQDGYVFAPVDRSSNNEGSITFGVHLDDVVLVVVSALQTVPVSVVPAPHVIFSTVVVSALQTVPSSVVPVPHVIELSALLHLAAPEFELMPCSQSKQAVEDMALLNVFA
tara:strand:- start:26 stop:367 length:342 start_codon:yes stop_codon:yes gene_type:complete